MNKPAAEEKPITVIERDPLLLGILALLSIFMIYLTYTLLRDMQPGGFATIVLAGILSFQTFWLFLTPFAEVFEERFEIRQSWFHQRERFFIDLVLVSENKRGQLLIRYTDGEVEKLGLFGIRRSQKGLLKQSCERQIVNSALKRA